MLAIRPSSALPKLPAALSSARPLSSNFHPKSPDKATPSLEHELISQLTPLKKILCLCPVPLGRGRVSWSGGDSLDIRNIDETIHMNFRTQSQQLLQPKVTKYRYGERYVLGLAVSDAHLTYAEPIVLNGREYVAEMVPSFRCDTHNLGSSPIFYTNLPHCRSELLQSINHTDIGAVVISLPMKQSPNPYSPAPTRIQVEQERKLEVVRDCLMSVLQNYIGRDWNGDDTNKADSGNAKDESSKSSRNNKQKLGPLGLQCFIDNRMSLADVLSRTNDVDRRSWGHITHFLQQIQSEQCTSGTNQAYGSHNTFTSIPPEIHAAVALNGMMEKYASAFHNTFI